MKLINTIREISINGYFVYFLSSLFMTFVFRIFVLLIYYYVFTLHRWYRFYCNQSPTLSAFSPFIIPEWMLNVVQRVESIHQTMQHVFDRVMWMVDFEYVEMYRIDFEQPAERWYLMPWLVLSWNPTPFRELRHWQRTKFHRRLKHDVYRL